MLYVTHISNLHVYSSQNNDKKLRKLYKSMQCTTKQRNVETQNYETDLIFITMVLQGFEHTR